MEHNAYIALGSNLGDREANIREGFEGIVALRCTELVARSSVIETDPIGPPGQRPYLNAVAHIRTCLKPRDLLDALLQIEKQCGRLRSNEERWGPRTLDLDVLLYADLVIDEPGLSVPHPRLHERLFVLVPLAELSPDIMVPVHEKTPRALLRALGDS